MRHPIRAPRGFVMVLVLLLVAALTAVVVGQLGVIRSQKLTAVRDNDQVQARAIAERCMVRVQKYMEQVKEDKKPPDWDIVLDPGLDSHPTGNGGSNQMDDDYVPENSFGGSIVYVPSSESSQTGQRKALHRWRVVEMDGGACLVRFDDNTDDFKKAGGGKDNSTVGKFENNGKDVPFRDRDMGIFISAMGIYPKATATAAADAYDRARARVSLKSFVGTGGAPGIVARNNVVLESNIALCGLGGLQATKLAYSAAGSPTSVCACGDTATNDITSAAHPGDCLPASGPGLACDPSLACQPGSSVNNAPAPQPDVKVPTPVHWLELDGFQDPQNPKPLGDNNVCEFYFRSDNVTRTWTSSSVDVVNDISGTFMNGTNERGEMFLWDHTDDDAQFCATANTRLAACASGQIVTHNCKVTSDDTTYLLAGKRVVKRPCRWSGGDSAAANTNVNGPVVTCDTPAEQTPCWKLIARFQQDGSNPDTVNLAQRAVVQQDHQTSDTCTASCLAGEVCSKGLCVPIAHIIEETTHVGGEVFSPNDAQRVPNIEAIWGDPSAGGGAPGSGASKNDGDAATITSNFWTNLCGPCPSCVGIAGWELTRNEHFHFDKTPMCGNNFFNPAILVFENQAQSLANNNEDGRFHVRSDWGTGCGTDIPKTTVIVQGHADIDQNTRVCGTWSDCATFPAPCSADSAALANGYVLRAGGECYVGEGAVFTGDMQCGVIHVNNGTGGECIVGDLIAFNHKSNHPIAQDNTSSALGVCPAAATVAGFVPDCSRGFCANQSFKMVGDLISSGDICIKAGAEIFGSVLGGGAGDTSSPLDGVTDGHVFIEANVKVHGQLVSEGHLGMKSGVTVNNNGAGIFGSRVTSGIRVDGSY